MPRRWYEISTTEDRRWTFATWLLFLGLTAFFGATLWVVTGKGPAWIEFVGTSFKASFAPGVPAGAVAHHDSGFFYFMMIATLTFVGPLIVAMIPALGLLLGISHLRTRNRDD